MKFFYYSAIFILFSSCSKKNSKKWFVEKSEISMGCLVQVNSNSVSFFEEPLVFKPNCDGQVFEESQQVNRIFNDPISQSFVLELPSDTSNFYYQNIEITSNTKFYIFNSSDLSFYRITNGWIKGEYINGSWEVDFDLFYGGKKNNKYHIKKGANY